MRKGLLCVLGACLIGASPAYAQTLPIDSASPTRSITPSTLAPWLVPTLLAPGSGDQQIHIHIHLEGPVPTAAPEATKLLPAASKLGAPLEPGAAAAAPAGDWGFRWPGSCGSGYRMWASADYLLWWVKGAPLPVPVVTTGDPNVGFAAGLNTAGGIGQSGTRVLLGGSPQDFGAFSGGRATIGGWIDSEGVVGIEGSGFLLARQSSTFAAGSDANGNPPLYFPRFNPAGFEDAVPIADPLRGFAGNVSVTSTLQLWGAEMNGVWNVWRKGGVEVNLLGGFRYVDLRETLQIQSTTSDLVFNNVATINDFFGTRNQFYGGQLGTRFSWQRDRLSVDFTGKVALGSTHEAVDIEGSTTQFGPNPLVPPGLGTSRGGIFAEPSNIGQRSANQLGVIPAVELKVGYQITDRLRAFAGYDFLYWNQVVRPGNQMDHNVNVTQNAYLDPNGVGALVGPAQPAPMFNRSDFWAQGVNFGLEFRY